MYLLSVLEHKKDKILSGLQNLNSQQTAEVLSKFISGAKNSDFSPLISLIPELGLAIEVVDLFVKGLAGMKVIKHPYNDKKILKEIEITLEKQKEITKFNLQSESIKKVAIQQENELYNKTAQAEIHTLTSKLCSKGKNLTELQKNDPIHGLLQNPEIRGDLVNDSEIRGRAIEYGYLKVKENGSLEWL